MPDNTAEGGGGSKGDRTVQASLCCVGMYLLPACSTHVACVGVLGRYRLCKHEYECISGNRRLDDVYFGTGKQLLTSSANCGEAICDTAYVYTSQVYHARKTIG